jgi:hypothetical protein
MNLEGLNSGTYTDEGLKLLFEYFYNFTEDSISKIEILEQWDEYENIQEAKKDYNVSSIPFVSHTH